MEIKEHIKIILVAIVLNLINLADMLVTKKVLAQGGIELNPVASFIISHNMWWIKVVNGLTLTTIIITLHIMKRRQTAEITGVCIIMYYTLIVCWNIQQITT